MLWGLGINRNFGDDSTVFTTEDAWKADKAIKEMKNLKQTCPRANLKEAPDR